MALHPVCLPFWPCTVAGTPTLTACWGASPAQRLIRATSGRLPMRPSVLRCRSHNSCNYRKVSTATPDRASQSVGTKPCYLRDATRNLGLKPAFVGAPCHPRPLLPICILYILSILVDCRAVIAGPTPPYFQLLPHSLPLCTPEGSLWSTQHLPDCLLLVLLLVASRETRSRVPRATAPSCPPAQTRLWPRRRWRAATSSRRPTTAASCP
jgi:hypothetical protein